jgi:Domain of unknown function DUF1828/Domain of unknown function DUF1829
LKELINKYVEWIREGMSFRQLGEWYEITTPFLNHHNDYLDIYVKPENGKFILTDGGSTINELKLSGVTLERSEKRTLELNTILNGFGIKRRGDELFANTTEKNFPETKHRLIQTMLAIDDMFMLSEPKVESFFIEDVADFFELKDIGSIRDTMFAGKSGFSHRFDFSIPKTKSRNETLVRAINTPRQDTISSVLWAFEDTKTIRLNTDGIVILNDKNDIPSTIFDALDEYGLTGYRWTQREELVSKLVA